MRIVAALALTLTYGLCWAQYSHPSFRAITETWVLSNYKVGSVVRVEAVQQNPYPFCFATAASLLWDQYHCNLNKNYCDKKTSFLALTPQGQGLELNSELDSQTGGSAFLSLEYLTQHGAVDFNVCNYNHLGNTQQSWTEALQTINYLNMHKTVWQRYQQRVPYLERYYRREYYQKAKILKPHINQTEVLELLQTNLTQKQLLSKLLINPQCLNTKPSPFNLLLKKQKVESTNQSFELINQLLQQKQPVLVSVCTHAQVSKPCETSRQHALIIASKSQATHKTTKDKRMVYWVVNSWGETWQKENADGWIFADSLLESLIGEIVWLEFKQLKLQ